VVSLTSPRMYPMGWTHSLFAKAGTRLAWAWTSGPRPTRTSRWLRDGRLLSARCRSEFTGEVLVTITEREHVPTAQYTDA
jgi:hypothetical protein